jgi:DNA adenine methylase
MKQRPLINYFGGKFTSRKWILANLPPSKTYVEPFGGGGTILLFKDRVKNEVYNDIDGEIVNVFKVVRDRYQELKRYLQFTPYSREVYDEARLYSFCPVERAAKTIIKSFMGIGDSINNNTGFRNSISQNSSPATGFKNYLEYLEFFSERLRGVIIERLDWKDCIQRYDKSHTTFYIDPPYLHNLRVSKKSYKFELTNTDHQELVNVLSKIKGHCLLSGYDNEIYDQLGWKKLYKTIDTQNSKRLEVLWVKK